MPTNRKSRRGRETHRLTLTEGGGLASHQGQGNRDFGEGTGIASQGSAANRSSLEAERTRREISRLKGLLTRATKDFDRDPTDLRREQDIKDYNAKIEELKKTLPGGSPEK